MKRSSLFPMLGIAAGVMSVIFAIVVFAGAGSGANTGTIPSYSYYGGDAYTGIQHAAADTARNVSALSELALGGLRSAGFILLVMGFGLIALSGARLTEYRAAAVYEQALLNALKQSGEKASGQAPAAAAPAAGRWQMDAAWPVADPGAVARKAEEIAAQPVPAPEATPEEAPGEAPGEAGIPEAEPAGETAPEEN